jgi:broad specificity phosphatase PhoE
VPTRFYLIRHGNAQYELAELRRLKGMGRDLVPLTAQGVEEIELAARRRVGLCDRTSASGAIGP